jgi:hypothetical protein
MHARGMTILPGRTRLDPFDADPQEEPPDGEFSQVLDAGFQHPNHFARIQDKRAPILVPQNRLLERLLSKKSE